MNYGLPPSVKLNIWVKYGCRYSSLLGNTNAGLRSEKYFLYLIIFLSEKKQYYAYLRWEEVGLFQKSLNVQVTLPGKIRHEYQMWYSENDTGNFSWQSQIARFQGDWMFRAKSYGIKRLRLKVIDSFNNFEANSNEINVHPPKLKMDAKGTVLPRF